MIRKVKLLTRTNEIPRLMVIALLVCAVFPGCRKQAETQKPAPTPPPPHTVAFSPAFSVLANEVNLVAGDSETLREARKTGILRAALDCGRPPLCFRDEYGVARGLEVDLLKQAAAAFGVKLNVAAPGETAQISGSTVYLSKPQGTDIVTYFYSRKTGWLAFKVTGDEKFSEALKTVVRRLYETGTYQQLYMNWLPAGEKAKGEKPN